MYLPMEKAEMVLRLLLEGNSVSSTERLTGIHHGTILKLLVLAGERCERLMARKIQNVPVRDVECDEVWSFIGKKEKRVRPEDDQNLGDCYAFVAIERHSKLVLNIAMGKRDQATTDVFIEGLRQATGGEFQITTDGFVPYKSAIETTLSDRVDFAQLIKVSARQLVTNTDILRPKFPTWRWSQLWATLILKESAPRLWNEAIS